MQAGARLPAGGTQPLAGQQQQQLPGGAPAKPGDGDMAQQLNLEAVRLRVQELQGTLQRMLGSLQGNYHLKWMPWALLLVPAWPWLQDGCPWPIRCG